MTGIPVFWLEPTEKERVWLRRFRSDQFVSADGSVVKREGCPLPMGYHDESTLLVDARPKQGHAIADPEHLAHEGVFSAPSKDDPRWPTHCACGFQFLPEDTWQVFPMPLYSGAPDGKLYTLRDAPAGAMWDAQWMRGSDYMTGPDGISLHVKLPNGHDWCVDQECSNCTRTQWLPKEIDGRMCEKVWHGRTHYCWVRHGDPRTGVIHVDKNGDTCAAGAGSIIAGNWHGFLHDSHLVPC